MTKYNILVIGGGPAGVTLAKMLGMKEKVAVIRPEDFSMIYCAMPYAVEGLMELEKTFKKDEIVTDAGADLIRSKAIHVDFENKMVTLESKDIIEYDKLIIATGAQPFIPPIKGADLKGVSGFKTEKDMRFVIESSQYGIKSALVVGAGAIGIELALSLRKLGLNVELVDMASTLLPNLVDPEMSEPIYEEIVRTGIHVHLNARVEELVGKEYVQQVKLSNGKVIHFDTLEDCNVTNVEQYRGLVVFATGMKPVVELFQNTGLEIGRDGIIIDNKMQSNIEDVYAVGDCAQFHSGITNEILSGKLATNAVPMAKVLGFNLLGQDRTYKGFYNGAATKVGDYYVGGTGLSEAHAEKSGFKVAVTYSEVTTKFPIMPTAKKVSMKLIFDKVTKRVLGGQVVSQEPVTDKIDILTLAIQNNFVLEQLTELSYSSQPYQSYYPAANLIVLAAEDALKKIS